MAESQTLFGNRQGGPNPVPFAQFFGCCSAELSIAPCPEKWVGGSRSSVLKEQRAPQMFHSIQKSNAAIKTWKKGQTKQEGCSRVNISRVTLDRYIKHYDIIQSDASVRYADLPSGQPNKIAHVVDIMKKSVAIQKKTMKQMYTQKTHQAQANKYLKAEQVNQLQTLPPISSRSWRRAYVKSCGSKKMRCSKSSLAIKA